MLNSQYVLLQFWDMSAQEEICERIKKLYSQSYLAWVDFLMFKVLFAFDNAWMLSLFHAFTLQSHPSFEMCFIVILASWYSFEQGTLVPNWHCLVFPITRITCVTFMKDKFLPAFNVWTRLATAAHCMITSGWQSHAKILPNLFILTVLTVRHISLMCCLQITPLLSPRGQICN